MHTYSDPALTSAGLSPPRRVGAREFRANFADLLRQVNDGQTFLVTLHDQVVAELRPPPPGLRPARVPGLLRGTITIADDFDTLPAEVLDAMEGGL